MNGSWMESEIRSQASTLAGSCGDYYGMLRHQLAGRSFDMVLLVARGSSDHAALYARYLIELRLGIPVVLAAPSVLTVYGRRIRYPKCLAIGISQSGAAPDVSEVLHALREDGHATLAITNVGGSRVAEEAEFVLPLAVGEEKSVAATKTYTASLLALYQTVRALDPSLPDPRESLPADEWVEACAGAARDACGIIVRSSPLFSIGRGYGFSTASEAAIKLMECALLPCKAYSSADFQHGPKALAGYGSAIVDFTGRLSETLGQPADYVVPPTVPSEVSEALIPIWQILFGQWLALYAARARGFDPDHPRFIQKVTETL